MTRVLIGAIDFYQKTLSPDHSFWAKARFPLGYCRFYPSCSEYAKQSIRKQGVVRGLLVSVWRVLRCNPFSQGGFDPVK